MCPRATANTCAPGHSVGWRKSLGDSLFNHHPGTRKDHPVGHLGSKLDLMRDDDHGHTSVCQSAHGLWYLLVKLGAERRGGFIEQYDLGTCYELTKASQTAHQSSEEPSFPFMLWCETVLKHAAMGIKGCSFSAPVPVKGLRRCKCRLQRLSALTIPAEVHNSL